MRKLSFTLTSGYVHDEIKTKCVENEGPSNNCMMKHILYALKRDWAAQKFVKHKKQRIMKMASMYFFESKWAVCMLLCIFGYCKGSKVWKWALELSIQRGKKALQINKTGDEGHQNKLQFNWQRKMIYHFQGSLIHTLIVTRRYRPIMVFCLLFPELFPCFASSVVVTSMVWDSPGSLQRVMFLWILSKQVNQKKESMGGELFGGVKRASLCKCFY